MVELTLYGKPTSTYEYVKMMIQRKIEKANIIINITEINDWEEIVNEKIESLPTIRMNGIVDMSYTEGQDINEFIQKVASEILKETNYGNMKKIIVPTDFSDAATNALVYAYGISKTLDRVVQLLHVYKPEVVHVESVVIIDEKLEKIKRQELKDYVTKVNQSWVGAEDDHLPIDSIFRLGFVVDELQELCKEDPNLCLIIAGSTGSSGAMKKIFGSVTTRLAKSSKSPLLIIPPAATYHNISDILYTVDSMGLDLKGVSMVVEFAKNFSAKIHLIHVKNTYDEISFKELIEYVNEISPETEVNCSCIIGHNVSEAINNYAVEHNIDIVSMSTKERGFFGDIFHKSISRQMAICTDIPLLIFHEAE